MLHSGPEGVVAPPQTQNRPGNRTSTVRTCYYRCGRFFYLENMVSKKSSGPKTYAIHPAAELFPMMSETEYEGLKEDIRLHGLQDDVLIWDGKLLDGRNRLRACSELGIEPGFAELPTSLDPVAWVLSHNLHRRHLTTSQRAMVATNLATLRNGEAGNGRKVGSGIPLPTQEDAAAKLNVSVDSVKKARNVRAKATPTVIAAVEAGTMSLNAAVATTKPVPATPKNGTESVSAAKLVDSLAKQHVGHIARGLSAIAKANGGEGKQFAEADKGLNQMILALQKMRAGER